MILSKMKLASVTTKRMRYPASEVLADGYGQCNTKAILIMAILRALEIPCRLHGFTIDKRLQKGAIRGLWYVLSPRSIVHTWVELNYKDSWQATEGCILDKDYLSSIQSKFRNHQGTFSGFGIADDDLQNPVVNWQGNSTFIQKKGINAELGLFDSPDDFYKRHSQAMGRIKTFIYQNIVHHRMNRNIRRLRAGVSSVIENLQMLLCNKQNKSVTVDKSVMLSDSVFE